MPVSRRLVAVVVADVVGYSRLMERDEDGTHQRLRALRDEVIAPKIAEHGGRTVKTTGDGMLLEFPSATSALRCAVEIQREMGVRNLYVAPDDRTEYRIGINLGDIIGDGVNVAARRHAAAAPRRVDLDSNLVAAHANAGDAERAAQARDKLLKVEPTFTIGRYVARFHATALPEVVAADERHYRAGLRKAGVPE